MHKGPAFVYCDIRLLAPQPAAPASVTFGFVSLVSSTALTVVCMNICLLVLYSGSFLRELELELIQTQMTQKPVLRAEVGMRVRCANKASAE